MISIISEFYHFRISVCVYKYFIV